MSSIAPPGKGATASTFTPTSSTLPTVETLKKLWKACVQEAQTKEAYDLYQPLSRSFYEFAPLVDIIAAGQASTNVINNRLFTIEESHGIQYMSKVASIHHEGTLQEITEDPLVKQYAPQAYLAFFTALAKMENCAEIIKRPASDLLHEPQSDKERKYIEGMSRLMKLSKIQNMQTGLLQLCLQLQNFFTETLPLLDQLMLVLVGSPISLRQVYELRERIVEMASKTEQLYGKEGFKRLQQYKDSYEDVDRLQTHAIEKDPYAASSVNKWDKWFSGMQKQRFKMAFRENVREGVLSQALLELVKECLNEFHAKNWMDTEDSHYLGELFSLRKKPLELLAMQLTRCIYSPSIFQEYYAEIEKIFEKPQAPKKVQDERSVDELARFIEGSTSKKSKKTRKQGANNTHQKRDSSMLSVIRQLDKPNNPVRLKTLVQHLRSMAYLVETNQEEVTEETVFEILMLSSLIAEAFVKWRLEENADDPDLKTHHLLMLIRNAEAIPVGLRMSLAALSDVEVRSRYCGLRKKHHVNKAFLPGKHTDHFPNLFATHLVDALEAHLMGNVTLDPKKTQDYLNELLKLITQIIHEIAPSDQPLKEPSIRFKLTQRASPQASPSDDPIVVILQRRLNHAREKFVTVDPVQKGFYFLEILYLQTALLEEKITAKIFQKWVQEKTINAQALSAKKQHHFYDAICHLGLEGIREEEKQWLRSAPTLLQITRYLPECNGNGGALISRVKTIASILLKDTVDTTSVEASYSLMAHIDAIIKTITIKLN